MASVNKTAAFITLNKFASARVELIQGLKDAGYTLETARGVVIEWACDKCKASFNTSKGGKIMLDSGHKNYEAAKETVRVVMLMLAGTTRHAESKKNTSTREEETEVPAELLAAAAKLAKLAAQYEGARSLASKALALAFAK